MEEAMNHSLIIILWIAYILLDAYEDSVLIKKHGGVYHTGNWLLRLVVSLIAGISLHGVSWLTLLWLIKGCVQFMFIFNIALNLLRRKDAFYVGYTAKSDQFIRMHFPNNPERAYALGISIANILAVIIYYWAK